MSLHDANPKQPEAEFSAIFESLKQAPLKQPFDQTDLEALRYAFRMTWAKNDFASIVQAGENLPEEVLRQDPLFLAYIAESKAQLGDQQAHNYAQQKIHPSVSRLLVGLDNFDYSGLDPADWDEAKRFIAEQRAKSLRESEELAKRLEENE
ncbi:hypothetical protein L0337_12135 [candidate division KSB1 bacterium]|nr:hypothetical protein [candidate division KSB1 bacterium]